MADPQQIQSNAISFAQSSAAMMDSYAAQALLFAYTPIDLSGSWSTPGYVTGYTGGALPAPVDIAIPTVTASRPSTPALNDVPAVTLPSAPALLAAEPIINLPSAPSSTLPSAPGAAPTFNTPVTPDTPTFSLPTAPTFAPVAIPVAPALDSMQFNEVAPGDTLTAPTETFAFAEQEYQSATMDALKAKLLADLVNGGYGIETNDENGLWERARERELLSMNAAFEDVMRQAAARGMMLPPGAMNTMLAQVQQDTATKVSSVSRDIALKRADMYVENRKFTIQEVRQLEDILTKMFGFAMERALNSAKALVELGIAAFHARLAQHNYRLERYKAAASVYEALIRGQLAKIEQYKAQVEGAKLAADTQRIHADVYRIQVDGVNALINVYRTEMEAAKLAAEIEQLKLQAFKTSVDAYASQVGARTAEFGMYESQIRGEMAKVNVFDAQVKTYATKTDAYKAGIEAQEVAVRAAVQTNTLKLEAYRSDIQRYGAELGAAQHELSGAIAKYEANIRKYSVTADAAIRASQQNIEAGKANADVAVAHANVIATSTIHAAQVVASRAAAAGSTMAAISSAYGSVGASALSASTGITASIATS